MSSFPLYKMILPTITMAAGVAMTVRVWSDFHARFIAGRGFACISLTYYDAEGCGEDITALYPGAITLDGMTHLAPIWNHYRGGGDGVLVVLYSRDRHILQKEFRANDPDCELPCPLCIRKK